MQQKPCDSDDSVGDGNSSDSHSAETAMYTLLEQK